MKKRKEEILRNKEHSTGQSTVQPSVQSAVQSNYVYGVGRLVVFTTSVCVFFAYNTFHPKNKKQANEKKISHRNDVVCFKKDIVNE